MAQRTSDFAVSKAWLRAHGATLDDTKFKRRFDVGDVVEDYVSCVLAARHDDVGHAEGRKGRLAHEDRSGPAPRPARACIPAWHVPDVCLASMRTSPAFVSAE
jgi:hypothetical protein